MKDYSSFIQSALYHAVKEILNTVAKDGLTDESYYILSFLTKEATLPDFVRQKYPHDITIILQNQFSNLSADDSCISVTLGFGGVPCDIKIPYTSLISFMDPSQNFALSFAPVQEKEVPPSQEMQTAEVIDLASLRKKS